MLISLDMGEQQTASISLRGGGRRAPVLGMYMLAFVIGCCLVCVLSYVSVQRKSNASNL